MKCEKGLTFEECELAILRHAVDKNREKNDWKSCNSRNYFYC